MLKVLGCAAILFAGSGLGAVVAGLYARRPADLRALQVALKMLETEITYTATPLAEALLRVAERLPHQVALFFARAGAGLGAGCTLQEAWEGALRECYAQSALAARDLAILRRLGYVLGISSTGDQSKHLRLAMEQLDLEVKRAEEEAARYVKLWRSLGFLGSLALIFTLW
ncbi:stage III sporulation protein AB [Desulfovirgula thermocuniculi]|uniref:stage III sporulation protein AB n=1 Tax=Desulfovirgula thermocuniculi TaxID=348842 RepID=UPI0003F8AE46|nr:stage III sporulation protein AB [Desulfovirgula thermocuniculi]